MNTSSRFAVLASEVDLDSAYRIRQKPKSNKPKNDSKIQAKIPPKNAKPAISNINKKKAAEHDLQALAFGFAKPKGNKKGAVNNNANKENKEKTTPKKKKGKSGTQATNGDGTNKDEDWHKRDEEFVQDQNEKSLREAILQSKLEYEQKKKVEAETSKKMEKEKAKADLLKASKSKKRKDKAITISLDQFNSLRPKELACLRDPAEGVYGVEDEDANNAVKFNEEKFFKDVEEATRRTLQKEHRQEQYKANASKVNQVNHEIQVKKFISEIEKRDFEIQALRLEVDSLRVQLQAVKGRNKKLCEVISSSEMRSKGELVVELDKATCRRDEFSSEIARLLGELEQERTKVSHLTTELKKMQGKKRTADSAAK